MFVGWDADNNDVAFVATVDVAPGEVIYFTDDEWDGTAFLGSEQLFEWTVPAGGIEAGTVVTLDMMTGPPDASFDTGGAVDYIRGGGLLARSNEMVWAFQGTRVGDTVTPTDFIGVIANEATGTNTQTPNLSGTGLTTSNGAIIIDGDEDYMEFTTDGTLSDPVTRDDLIAEISDTSNWTTADGGGNNNPNGTGFDVVIPDVVCFTSGTLIRTPFGPRPVETLFPGDTVLTVDEGPQMIRWVGRRTLSLADLMAHPNLRPVTILKDAIAPGCPDRDMCVSPQHRLLINKPEAALLFGQNEVLAPAMGLVDGRGIDQQAPNCEVTYHHLMFDRHQIIFGGGAPSESFYPGPQAMAALSQDARAELARLFPDLARSGDPHLAFGARARRFAAPRTLPRQLSGLRFLAA